MTTVDKSTKLYSTFDPRNIPNCVLWLDFADSSSVTLSGSNITALRDKSNLNQTITIFGTPTQVSTLNTKNIATVTAGGFRAQLTNSLTNYTHTAFIVNRLDATPVEGQANLAISPSATQPSPYTVYRSIDYAASNFRSVEFLTGGSVNTFGIASSNNAFIWTSQYDGGSAMSGFVNGGASSATQVGSTPGVNGSYISVGGEFYTSVTPTYWKGIVAEVILYNFVLTSTQRQQVEGYLAWKWGLQGNLPAAHSYNNTTVKHGPYLSTFRPTDLSSTCALWFDAADTSKITGTTQVTAWVNKGTISTTASNFTGSCTSGNTINGLNFVRCPAGTEMRFTAALNTQARSWFYVGRLVTTLTSGTYAGAINQTGGAGQDSLVFAYVDASNNGVYIGPSGVAVTVGANLPSSTLSNMFMVSAVNSVTSSSNVLTLNGTSYSLSYSASAASYNVNSLAYRIGTSAYNTSIDIMEVVFYYGNLTSYERQIVEGYLAWKWKIQGNLPSTHPFKNFPPLKPN